MTQIVLHEVGMAVVVERPPDCHRLRPEASIRKADDQRRARAQYPRNIAQYGYRLLQILNRHADHCRVDDVIREREPGVTIEVLDEPAGEPGIGSELGRIHTMPDDF